MKYNFEVLPYLIKEPTIIYVDLLNRKEKYPLACVGRDSYIWRGLINTGLEYTVDMRYTTHNIQIGNFNSLAEGIEFCMGINHSYSNLCMGVSKLFEGKPASSAYNQKGQIIIQNDVWIGHKCTIMPGVIIHNGAVVAANSHVVKDVPPYAIVGGNPAKVIKYRFSQELIDKLLTIQWWNWTNDEIKNNIKYFNEDIAKFCDIFYEKYKTERENVKKYEIAESKHNILFFVDFTITYNIYERVIEQFINKYKDNSDYQLILFVDKHFTKNNPDLIDYFNKSIEEQIKKAEALCKLNVCIDDINKGRSLFKAVDYYITSRAKETVLYSEYADEFNVKIISGVDTFIFHEM
jgi:virginiamycin A acetyltransferase